MRVSQVAAGQTEIVKRSDGTRQAADRSTFAIQDEVLQLGHRRTGRFEVARASAALLSDLPLCSLSDLSYVVCPARKT